jgi:hypothetical protein
MARPRPDFNIRKKPPAPTRTSDLQSDESLAAHLGKNPPTPSVTPKLPFMPGDVVYTKGEEAILRKLGHKKGDPVPTDLPAKLAVARAAQEAEYAEAIDKASKTGRVLKMPQTVDIDNLSTDHREELRKAMLQAKEDLKAFQAGQFEEAELAGMTPSVRAALEMSRGGIELVDDSGDENPNMEKPEPTHRSGVGVDYREEVKRMKEEQEYQAEQQRQTEKEMNQATPSRKSSTFSEEILQAKREQSRREMLEAEAALQRLQAEQVKLQQEYEAAAKPDEAPLGTGVLPATCPQCSCVLADPTEIKPTQVDLMNYVLSFSGGGKFLKEYSLLGGRVRVVFRGLSSEASDAALTRASVKQANGNFSGWGQYWSALASYRMVAGIHAVRLGNESYDVSTEVDGALKDGQPIDEVFDEVRKSAAFNNESLWRVMSSRWADFERLLRHLEDQSSDPSFCDAIVG